jgi:hypothetical protein
MPWCPECGAEYREGFTRCSECRVALVNEPPPGTERPAEPGPEWVEVAGYTTVEEARFAQGLLQEQGIRAEVVDKHVVAYPFPQTDEAEVLLLVAPADLDRADAMLAEAETGRDALAEEADTGSEGTDKESG